MVNMHASISIRPSRWRAVVLYYFGSRHGAALSSVGGGRRGRAVRQRVSSIICTRRLVASALHGAFPCDFHSTRAAWRLLPAG